jgi:hypothetical protein
MRPNSGRIRPEMIFNLSPKTGLVEEKSFPEVIKKYFCALENCVKK